MALATQCPHCKTIFRVAQDQLKLRGGIVRCGACHEIFDGQASLVDLNAPAAAPAEAPVAAPAAHEPPEVAEPAAPAPESEEDVPVYALDLGAALGPLGILPKPESEDDTAAADIAAVPFEVEVAAIEHAVEDLFADEAAPVQPGEDQHEPANPAHGDDDEPALADAAPEEALPAASAGGTAHADEPSVMPLAGSAQSGELAAEDAATAVMDTHDDRVEPTLGYAGEELAPGERGEHVFDHDAAAGAGEMTYTAVEHAPLPQRESAGAAAFTAPRPPRSARARQQARRSKLTPTRIDDAPRLRVPEIDEPEFVKRGRQREQSGKRITILMAVGSVVLLLVLAAQAALIFRNDLVARMPGTRPALAAMCSLLHCRVELPARIDNLTIETGELQTLGPDTYVLATLLHNQSGAMQAWPDIELALTDATDKPLVRRVFAPADYLAKGAPAGFSAHGEQAVKLYFQLDGLKPSGYHIAVFYP